MAVRIIKNNTSQEFILNDLGDLLIPSNGAVDIGGDENQLISLASSRQLISMLASNEGQIYVNDGSRDYDHIEGLDLILRISPPSTPTELDPQGRWIVRSDSRRKDYDTVFQGCGDNLATGKIGEGTDFRFDFSDSTTGTFITAPEGFKRKQVNWNFIDLVYMKGGSLSLYDIPKGSYVDFYLISPPGYPYFIKSIDAQGNIIRSQALATTYTKFVHWVIKHWICGTRAIDINGESASDLPSYPFMIFSAEVTVPEVEGWEKAGGNWVLQFFRNRTIVF